MAVKHKTDQDFINSILLDFAQELVEQRRQNVRKERAINTEELLRSYDYEVRKATIQQTGAALIAFEERGRYLDMKRLDRKTHQIPIEEVKKWLLEGGLEKFRQLPTDAQGRTAFNHRPLLNDLAWGVVRKIKKRGGYRRRRRLQVGFENAIQILISELRTGYLDRSVEEIKDSLLKKLNNVST